MTNGRNTNPWNLTPRECEVLEASINYGTTENVATELGIKPKTVESFMQSIRLKMRPATNRLQAAVFYDRWKRGQPAP